MTIQSAARISLSAGDLSLDLAPELGGCVAAFRHGAIDIMRPLLPPPGAAPHALHSGMFPMAPFANSVRDNRFSIDGREFHLPPNMDGAALNYHGSGWQRPWRVAEATADRCRLVLDPIEEAPGYSFSAEQLFELSPHRLAVTLSVTNRSPKRMPFGFGLHPWFPRHGDAVATFAATGTLEEDADFQALGVVPLTADTDFSAGRAPARAYQNRCYVGWSGIAHLRWADVGLELGITADPVFSHLMFHVPAHDFETFCLEPQSNRTSAFDGVEAGRPAPGVHILVPGETVSGSVVFAVQATAG